MSNVGPWLVLVSHFIWLVGSIYGQGTVAPEEAPAPLKPIEAAKRFKLPKDLSISLVVSEPQVAQPLSISFDDRGRMWVLQYRQFPNPNGLKPIQIDNWLRTKYDKIPAPPPHGPRGHDRISIYEDTSGDGLADKTTHFVSDLNLASGMALGHGGVFVVQPPYLLFYADRDRDDKPDGPPEVLLTGFGMEDAHAFANSLTWGPDGWLYGAQGSTATADIRGIGFQQGVWRYHPRTRRFECFAEGGGNTWGIDFDRFGNLFAGGNTVQPLVHHVQGAYYVKGFGKHGPLHNPHAYGYFQPVTHHGYVGDSLTGGFVLYQGGAFPNRFNGQCIAPNTRHSASRWSTIERLGSTFVTRAAGDFITTSDIWFRPIESTVGPDGALYVADWYDYNISHSSPKNRSRWYQPSRDDGRVWRVAPKTLEAVPARSINLRQKSSRELVQLLTHQNAWYVRKAQLILAERRDRSVLPQLQELIKSDDQAESLQGVWATYVTGGFTEELAQHLLSSRHPYVRAWAVRLVGDDRVAATPLADKIATMAQSEDSAVVRSQLACSAKRLDGPVALQILRGLWHYDDSQDTHIPLLTWWALEDKALREGAAVLRLFGDDALWSEPVVEQYIVERLARRFVAEDSERGFDLAAQFLDQAPAQSRGLVLRGFAKALHGRATVAHAPKLATSLRKLGLRPESELQGRIDEILVRLGEADQTTLERISGSKGGKKSRVDLIRALGQTRSKFALPSLLKLATSKTDNETRSAALSSVGYFDSSAAGQELLAAYAETPHSLRPQIISLLCGRAKWSEMLVEAVATKRLSPNDVSAEHVRAIHEHGVESLSKSARSIWGQVRAQTPLQKEGRINAVVQSLYRGKGDAINGKILFTKHCATCHKLHGEGIQIGPDLTGAERRDRGKLIQNIVDPNSEVRPQYVSYKVATEDGRVVTGIMSASTPTSVTLVDGKNRRVTIDRKDIAQMKESPVSLMPEKLLDELTDQQVRDLVAYIQSEGKAK